MFEREIADTLGIDYDSVQQVTCSCLADADGTEFKPSPREPLRNKLHWDRW